MLERGSFWREVAERTAAALSSGALQPIATSSFIIEDGGVRFLTRVVENLQRKRLAQVQQPGDFDPFLHPEKELFVAEVSETHFALLNKFNLVERHLLLVTRRFEEQLSRLTAADFEAVWLCLAERNALSFYNAGPDAGASQRHKHLQLVPVPLGEGPEPTPIEHRLDSLPFPHALCFLDDLAGRSTAAAAAESHQRYSKLLAEVGDPQAYNLLATRDWMLLVPRRRESFESISVNALGFAGALLVRSREELTRLKRIGPMRLLQEVAGGA